MAKPFSETHLGQLRKLVGSRELQVPAFRAVLVDPEGRILLQKRSDYGIWGIPGGHPEEGESISQCVLREVEEETGLILTRFEPYGFSSDPMHERTVYPNGDRVHTFGLLVWSDRWKGKLVHSNEECLELGFYPPETFPEVLPHERICIDSYLEFRRSGRFQLA